MPLDDTAPEQVDNVTGLFISLEGLDGVGKTTQLDLLEQAFSFLGKRVVRLREPGGTRLGEQIRALLLDKTETKICGTAELLLFEAARAELVFEAILPALKTGSVVLCDRFFDSTTAYQGYGRQLGASLVDLANGIACDGIRPDRTIILDLDAHRALDRATAQGADRMESEGDTFRQAVHEGFLAIAENDPMRVKLVDASGTKEDVWNRIRESLCDLAPLPDYCMISKRA